MQRFIVFAFLIFTTGFLSAQNSTVPGPDLVTLSHSGDPEINPVPIPVEERDENIFLCNWITDQTFAYWNEKNAPELPRVVCLLGPGEQFCMPIYGQLWSVFKKSHNGLDIHLNTGDSVRAAFGGKVRYAQYNKGGFGNLVIVRHASGLETYYAHFSKLLVTPGQEVKAGEVVGLGGSTGRSKGPHLHFEVRYHDRPLDPFSFIDYEKKRLKRTQLELNSAVFEPWNTTQPVTDTVRPTGTVTALQEAQTVNPPPVLQDETVYYTVKKGDTLYSISVRHKTTVAAVCRLNSMKETDILSIGKKLRIH